MQVWWVFWLRNSSKWRNQVSEVTCTSLEVDSTESTFPLSGSTNLILFRCSNLTQSGHFSPYQQLLLLGLERSKSLTAKGWICRGNISNPSQTNNVPLIKISIADLHRGELKPSYSQFLDPFTAWNFHSQSSIILALWQIIIASLTTSILNCAVFLWFFL